MACTKEDELLVKEGIGSKLYSDDLAAATNSKEQYFGFICMQAGLPHFKDSDTTPRCDSGANYSNPPFWTAVVYQAMNDIDRRCDAYLTWLDNTRRSQEPLLAQVNATRDLTHAAMRFAGSSNLAIDVVAQAFGFAHSTLTNYHARLVLVVNQSTVNTVVLKRRADFRGKTRSYRYSTKPDAEHAIRTYLRICLPMTIETEINELSALGAQGVLNPGDRTVFSTPVVSHGIVAQIADSSNRDFQTLKDFGSSSKNREQIFSCGTSLGFSKNETFDITVGQSSLARANRKRILNCLKDRGSL